MNYKKTVDFVNIDKFMKKWYVIAGRTTYFEKGAYNSVEEYKWNEKDKQIDIMFTYNQDSLEGKVKTIPQTAWIYNKKTNSHWKVRPIWPLKLSYLIIALADDYSWTAIGVPSGKYLWIMAAESKMSENQLTEIINKLKDSGYPVNDIKRVIHD